MTGCIFILSVMFITIDILQILVMLRRIINFCVFTIDLNFINDPVGISVGIGILLFVYRTFNGVIFLVGFFIVAEGSEQSRGDISLSVFGNEEVFL